MAKKVVNKINIKNKWIVPAILFSALLISCSELNQMREYQENPLCNEMRRKCKEYDEYKELAGKKKSQRLDELYEECYEYSKSCGHEVGKAGE